MSKVVLFSTRCIHDGKALFGEDCTCTHIVKDQSSPLIHYFTSEKNLDDDEKGIIKKLFPSDPKEKIISYCKSKGVWKDNYDENPDTHFQELGTIGQLKYDPEYRRLTLEHLEHNSSPFLFDISKFLNAIESSPIKLNIDYPKEGVSLGKRFSVYIHGKDYGEAIKQEYIFMAIWPLDRTEKTIINGHNIWITSLAEQIKLIIPDCSEIILLLHDKDIADKRPFDVIIPEGEIKVQEMSLKLKVAVFQHSPGDPINEILNKPATELKIIYEDILNILSNAAEMMKAGKWHSTRQVYEQIIKTVKP